MEITDIKPGIFVKIPSLDKLSQIIDNFIVIDFTANSAKSIVKVYKNSNIEYRWTTYLENRGSLIENPFLLEKEYHIRKDFFEK